MKKTKIYIIISIIITAILFICAIYFNFFIQRDFETPIKEITKNTKLIDANDDHNQALDVIDYAKANGIDIPKILINFDTHSDIWLNYPQLTLNETNVGNWINELLANNPEIDEVYWVMPFDEAVNLRLQLLFAKNDKKDLSDGTSLYGNSVKYLKPLKFVLKPLFAQSYTQEFLLDSKTGMLNEIDKDSDIAKDLFDPKIKYKKIKLTTCTEKTLPDFKGKKVFLSIDADYLSNSGFDTMANWVNNKTHSEIHKLLFSMLKTIDEKNIRPVIFSMSLSPQYLPQKDHKYMSEFFEYVIDTSGKKDVINFYTRRFEMRNEHNKY